MADAAVLDPVVTPPASTPPPAMAPAPNDWRTYMTDELKADPIVSKWAEKASEKDIASLVKSTAHAQSRMGSAINLPGKDAKPEEVTALKQKLVEAGLLPTPIADPKEYGLVKPEQLPPGVEWSDERADKLAGMLHKYQVPKEAAAELMALHMEALSAEAPSLAVDREAAMAALKTEHGSQYDARVEMAKRMMSGILKTPEELQFMEQTGLADHPQFLSVLLRLAPLAMQDSSFVNSLPVGRQEEGGATAATSAKAELSAIMSDKTHPMHERYYRHDKTVLAHIQELYKKAYPEVA